MLNMQSRAQSVPRRVEDGSSWASLWRVVPAAGDVARGAMGLFVTLSLFAGCSSRDGFEPMAGSAREGAQSGGGVVVARVGSAVITADMFQDELIRRGGDVIENAVDPSQRRILLDELIERELLAQAAEKSGFADDPEIEVVRKRMMAKKYLDSERFAARRSVAVNDDDVKRYYDANIERFSEPEHARGAMVFVKFPSQATPEQKVSTREKAAQVRDRVIDAGNDPQKLAAIVRESSDESRTALRGGDTGWLPKGFRTFTWPAPVIEALFAIRDVGGVAAPVETERGVYIVKLTERRAASAKELAEVDPQVRADLIGEREKVVLAERFAALRANLGVSVDELALANVTVDRSAARAGLQPPAFPVGQ